MRPSRVNRRGRLYKDPRLFSRWTRQARAGWDACTDLRTPNGQKLLDALQ